MASDLEELQEQRRDVWQWRRREYDDDNDPATGAVPDVQRARRAYERSRHSPEKHAVAEAETKLKHVRKMLDAAEDKLDRMEREYSKLTPGQKSVDYWRDAVQDYKREVVRLMAEVRGLRRDEKEDRLAAKPEIDLATSLAPPALSDDLDEDDREGLFGNITDAATGTVLGDTMVFTNKAALTDSEQRLVVAKGRLEHARAMYRKALARRKKEKEPSGGTGKAAEIVAAAKACEAKSNTYHYSQPGGWRLGYYPEGEPWGIRSDCSQFVTKCYYHAGARDPNGMNYNGGYTGTLGRNGRRVSSPQPGDLCLVGTGTFYHVELVIDSGGTTIGHGDRHVNRSHINFYRTKQLRRYV